jgi:hypothetical protein
MKTYKDKITLTKNNRGCYILDTVKGCSVAQANHKGCYDNCYAQNIASRYAFNFGLPIKRKFEYDTNQLFLPGFYDTKHENEIIKQIKKINMPFIRIGEMGDPSEDWNHTLNICKVIAYAEKPIVIITKHLKLIPEDILNQLAGFSICINTSISALDNWDELDRRLRQFHKLKKYCKSVLRIVSCDFNRDLPEGETRAKIQAELFKNDKIINTVFRPSLENQLVVKGVIKTKKVKFLKSDILASVYYDNSYLGYCGGCPDMCGINL